MFSYSFSFPHFVQNPKFQFRVKLHLLVIIVLVFLFNAQTYKLQLMHFFYHLFDLISKLCVCSFLMMQMRHIK
jgi:hypothetical protein